MEVLVLQVDSNELIQALIKEGKRSILPSFTDGWVFDFHKRSKNKTAYVLVLEETPETIESCMIFSLNQTFGTFLDYLEVAPHNKGKRGDYKRISGCLIAFACGLSFEKGMNEDKGILTFQAYSKTESGKKRLEKFYREKYKAIKNPWGYMEIHPNQSRTLMEEYLNNNEN